jgi:hypothetical protein
LFSSVVVVFAGTLGLDCSAGCGTAVEVDSCSCGVGTACAVDGSVDMVEVDVVVDTVDG